MSYLLASVATFGENLTRLRERAGFRTSKALADAVGVVPSMISRLENDLQGLPEGPTLIKLAKTLHCSVDELLESVDQEYADMLKAEAVVRGLQHDADADRIDVSGHTPRDIPVIAEGEASPQGNLFWDNEGKLLSDVEDRITRPFDVDDPRAYGVRVRGDSMIPIYRSKMIVVVSPATPVSDGDEVYVQLLSGERLIKIARRATDGWILESANPAYPARFVKTAEIGAIHPIVWARRRERGRRLVEDMKRKVERRVAERRGTAERRGVKQRHEPVTDHPDEFPEAAIEDTDEGGHYGDES